jgi:hypothetical protein
MKEMDRDVIEREARRIHQQLVDLKASSFDILDIVMIVMAHTIGNLDDPRAIEYAATGARKAITMNERIALSRCAHGRN